MERIAELFAFNKYERIRELRRWGLNTPQYVYFKKGFYTTFSVWAENQNWEDDRKTSARFFAKQEDGTMGQQPHLPALPWEKIQKEVETWIKYFDVMIMTETIDPRFCDVCGNLEMELHSIDGYGIARFEIRWGAGTVRRVQEWSHLVECNLHGAVRDKKGNFLPQLTRVKWLATKCPYWNRGIFEWSYYKTPVGWKKENIIFWEIRRR